MKFYLYIQDSQVRLIPAEKIPVKRAVGGKTFEGISDSGTYNTLKREYESSLQKAKQESILCADQATAEAEIYFKYFASGKAHDGLKEGEIYGPLNIRYFIKNRCIGCGTLEDKDCKSLPDPCAYKAELVAIISEPERKIIIPAGTIKEGDVLTFKGDFINPDHTIRMVKQEEEKDRDLIKLIDEKHEQLEREDRARRVTNSSQLQVMAGPNFKKEEEQEQYLWSKIKELESINESLSESYAKAQIRIGELMDMNNLLKQELKEKTGAPF